MCPMQAHNHVYVFLENRFTMNLHLIFWTSVGIIRYGCIGAGHGSLFRIPITCLHIFWSYTFHMNGANILCGGEWVLAIPPTKNGRENPTFLLWRRCCYGSTIWSDNYLKSIYFTNGSIGDVRRKITLKNMWIYVYNIRQFGFILLWYFTLINVPT